MQPGLHFRTPVRQPASLPTVHGAEREIQPTSARDQADSEGTIRCGRKLSPAVPDWFRGASQGTVSPRDAPAIPHMTGTGRLPLGDRAARRQLRQPRSGTSPVPVELPCRCSCPGRPLHRRRSDHPRPALRNLRVERPPRLPAPGRCPESPGTGAGESMTNTGPISATSRHTCVHRRTGQRGFQLNEFCMSLTTAENRERFTADERAYMDEWPAVASRRLTRGAHRRGTVRRTAVLPPGTALARGVTGDLGRGPGHRGRADKRLYMLKTT